MGETLTIIYDKIGDFLFIDVCHPYAEQDSNEIGESLVGRFNLETGEIETVEILFFFAWLRKEGEIRIPISAALWPLGAAPPNGAAPSRANEVLTVKYDQAGDILTLEQRPPHPGQQRREICEVVSAKVNSETGEIESLEIRRFKTRMEEDGEIVLPINATLRPIKRVVSAG